MRRIGLPLAAEQFGRRTVEGQAPGQGFVKVTPTPNQSHYWIDIIAPFVVATATLLRALDRGRGVYISMSWFAPGAFVPTSV